MSYLGHRTSLYAEGISEALKNISQGARVDATLGYCDWQQTHTTHTACVRNDHEKEDTLDNITPVSDDIFV